MITVIIPTRNALGFLRETVASVLAQSFVEWELIVVDDASEDGTWRWLESLHHPRIRPIHLRERGWQSAARNAGLREAKGEFVLFLDHDDCLLPGALERLLQALQSHESAIAAVGARVNFGAEGRRRVRFPRLGHFRDVWLDVMFGWAPQCGGALLRKSAVTRAGGWRDQYIPAEDHDFWVRLSHLGPVVLIPQAVLGYRVHAGQTLKLFEASHAARTTRTILLRRSYLSGLGEDRRGKAGRTVDAWRHHWVAKRAFRRGRYRVACRNCWLAVRQAPWLLESPLSRPEMTGLGLRSLLGAAIGDSGISRLRRLKRALAGAVPGRSGRQPLPRGSVEIGRPEAR